MQPPLLAGGFARRLQGPKFTVVWSSEKTRINTDYQIPEDGCPLDDYILSLEPLGELVLRVKKTIIIDRDIRKRQGTIIQPVHLLLNDSYIPLRMFVFTVILVSILPLSNNTQTW